MISYYTQLQKTASAFKQAQKNFLSGNIFSKIIKNSPKYKQKHWDKKPLYIQGQVTYAGLVQANDLLFRLSPHRALPAAVIFSHDEYYKKNPKELNEIGMTLFSYKNKTNAPEGIKKIVHAITDEHQSLHNVPLPTYISQGRQVYYTTIIVYRCHLPHGKIIEPIFPIVADMKKPKETYIVPMEFWTSAFRDYYIGDIPSQFSCSTTYSDFH